MSALARVTLSAPSSRRTASRSTREAPSIRTSTGTPSAAKIRDLQIWLSSQPTAAAASAAVRVASGSRRTSAGGWARRGWGGAWAKRGWAAEPWGAGSWAAVVMRGTLAAGGPGGGPGCRSARPAGRKGKPVRAPPSPREPSPAGVRRPVPGRCPGWSDPDQLPVLVALLLLAAGLQLLALDVDVGQDPVQPLRQPPGAPAEQGQDGRDDRHADDERVEEDGDRESEADHLDHGLGGADEAGEDGDHDDGGGGDHPGTVPEAGDDGLGGLLAVDVRLPHAGHEEDLV